MPGPASPSPAIWEILGAWAPPLGLRLGGVMNDPPPENRRGLRDSGGWGLGQLWSLGSSKKNLHLRLSPPLLPPGVQGRANRPANHTSAGLKDAQAGRGPGTDRHLGQAQGRAALAKVTACLLHPRAPAGRCPTHSNSAKATLGSQAARGRASIKHHTEGGSLAPLRN